MKYYTINGEAARAAHNANSMRDYPKDRTTNNYRSYVDKATEIAEGVKKKCPDEAERVDYYLDRYAKRLAEWYNENSRVEAMCPSIMISGAGNFPVRKKEAQNSRRDTMMRKWEEIEKIIERIKSCGRGGIKSNDAQALEKLHRKLEVLTDGQEDMKAANAYYRKNKTLDGCPGLSAKTEEWLTRKGVFNHGENGTPLEFYGTPYPSYSLANNSAEIRRTKKRIEELEKVKEVGTQERTEEEIGIAGLKVVENAEAMRIQLIFEDKPDEDTRTILKRNGFRWSPRYSAWQRDLNDNGKNAVRKVISILKKAEEAQ